MDKLGIAGTPSQPRHDPTPLMIAVGLALAVLPTDAVAYVGPGLATGALGAVLGVIGSIFLAIFAIVYYPIKRVLRAQKQRKKNKSQE